MKENLLIILGVMLLLSVSLVSAVTYDNVEAVYYPGNNTVNFQMDEIYDDECVYISTILIIDSSGNVVGNHTNGVYTVCSIWQNGVMIMDMSWTGIAHRNYNIELEPGSYDKLYAQIISPDKPDYVTTDSFSRTEVTMPEEPEEQNSNKDDTRTPTKNNRSKISLNVRRIIRRHSRR